MLEHFGVIYLLLGSAAWMDDGQKAPLRLRYGHHGGSRAQSLLLCHQSLSLFFCLTPAPMEYGFVLKGLRSCIMIWPEI